MEPKYSVYQNSFPGYYTVHIDISAASDKEAVALSKLILEAVQEVQKTEVMFLTDSDDWAEHVHHDDHPNAVRTGCGRRIVIDENGHLVP
jgi:hypothetical protein